MDYLNQDDPVLRRSATKRAYAVDELLKRALQRSHSFRMQFDAARLCRVVGAETLRKLMPKFAPDESKPAGRLYDIYADVLDPSKIEILRQLLTLAPPSLYAERPLNYIKSTRFLDRENATVLRGGDHNNFILFALPPDAREALLNSYRSEGIPETVIEQVDVDVGGLEP